MNIDDFHYLMLEYGSWKRGETSVSSCINTNGRQFADVDGLKTRLPGRIAFTSPDRLKLYHSVDAAMEAFSRNITHEISYLIIKLIYVDGEPERRVREMVARFEIGPELFRQKKMAGLEYLGHLSGLITASPKRGAKVRAYHGSPPQ